MIFWKRKTINDNPKQDDREKYAEKIKFEMNNVKNFISNIKNEYQLFSIAYDATKVEHDYDRRQFIAKKNLTDSKLSKVNEIINHYHRSDIWDTMIVMEKTLNNMQSMYAELDKQLLFLSTKDCLEGVLDAQKGYKSDETIQRIQEALDDIDYHANYEAIVGNIEDTMQHFKI